MRSILLKPVYNKVLGGLPVLGKPADVAVKFTKSSGAPNIHGALAFYTGLSGATGFVCGLPGFLMLPFTLPANVLGVAALQLHMIATLALMGGHDVHDVATRDRCIACMLKKLNEPRLNTEEEEVVARTGSKLIERGVRLLAERTTRFAVRAVQNSAFRRLGVRRYPLVGGIIGAGSDAYVTLRIGQCARETFLNAA